MKKGEIKAVEMVRRIRNEHHELLKGKSLEERRRFYRENARALREKLGFSTDERRSA